MGEGGRDDPAVTGSKAGVGVGLGKDVKFGQGRVGVF